MDLTEPLSLPLPPRASRSNTTVVPLGEGRRVVMSEDRLSVVSPDGDCMVEIELGGDAPVVRVAAGRLELCAARSLAIDTPRFSLRTDHAELDVRGDLVECVAGNVVRHAEGAVCVGGSEVVLAAHCGDVRLRATDDVDVQGERVRLNCDDPPMPRSWEEHAAQQRLAETNVAHDGDLT